MNEAICSKKKKEKVPRHDIKRDKGLGFRGRSQWPKSRVIHDWQRVKHYEISTRFLA